MLGAFQNLIFGSGQNASGQQINLDNSRRIAFAKDLKKIYDDVIQGNIQSYKDLVNTVKKISSLIPEFSAQGGRNIDNYSQQELEYIVEKFIVKVQQQQINVSKNNSQYINEDKNTILKEKRQKAQLNWTTFASQYYEENKNNINDLAGLLNNGKNLESTQQKIYDSLVALQLYKDVIYNKTAQRFEFIRMMDPKSDGTRAIKLSLSLFKSLIQARVPALNIDIKADKQTYVATLKSLISDPQIQLHPNVKMSKEYKFMVKLLQYQQMSKKYNRLNRFMQKGLNRKTKQPLDEITDQLFNKFKSFNKKDLDGKQKLGTQPIIDQMLLQQQKQAVYDPFRPIQSKYGTLQVLEQLDDVNQKYKQVNDSKLASRLLQNLPYIPQSNEDAEDIYETAQFNQRKGGFVKNQLPGVNFTNAQVRAKGIGIRDRSKPIKKQQIGQEFIKQEEQSYIQPQQQSLAQNIVKKGQKIVKGGLGKVYRGGVKLVKTVKQKLNKQNQQQQQQQQ